MRLDEIRDLVRHKVNDEGSIQYTDAEINLWINRVQAGMFRAHVSASESYANHRIDLLGSDAIQVHTGIYQYELPTWVHTVSEVRVTEPSSSNEGRLLYPEIDWEFDRRTAIRTLREGSSLDITVKVTKVPARLHEGTFAKAGPSANQLYLDTAASPQESIADAYVNSLIEVTGVESSSHLVVGQVRRILSSSRVNDAGTVRTLVTLNRDLAVNVTTGDTYSFHAELDDSHIDYLVLMTAEHIYQKTDNKNGIAAMQPAMTREQVAFMNRIQPRNTGEPGFWRQELDRPVRTDPDREALLGIL